MPRTTLDLEAPILRELKRLQRNAGKSLGNLVSELLAEALASRRNSKPERPPFRWISRKMDALVDLSDKDALYSVLDGTDFGADRTAET